MHNVFVQRQISPTAEPVHMHELYFHSHSYSISHYMYVKKELFLKHQPRLGLTSPLIIPVSERNRKERVLLSRLFHIERFFRSSLYAQPFLCIIAVAIHITCSTNSSNIYAVSQSSLLNRRNMIFHSLE